MSPRHQLRIVCLGGGTGMSMLLRGLKLTGSQITAIVTLTDDGGSSGRLRRDLAMPPPGDIRNCLIALAEDESLMNRLFRHRFDRGELAGHAFGNIFLAALTEVVGSFDAAVAEVGRVLAVEGSVVPATTHPAALLAEMDDGRYVAGETAVARDRQGVRRLFLSPADAVANPQALAAVERADLIVMGPGSLFTSTLPPLLVPGLGRAVLNARGLRVYVCNLLQQPGETIGYSASHHVERLHQHVGAKVIDSVMVPRRALVTEKIPVEFDRRRLGELGVRVVAAQIVADDGYHHDPEALARSCAPRSAACAAAVPFSEDVRAELAEVLPVQPHCRLAQLAGVVRHAGTFHLLAGGAVEVHVDLASPLAARRTVELLRTRGATCEIRTYREHRFERATRFLIVVGGDARSLQALHEAGVLGPSLAPTEHVPGRIVARGCCRRSYLRGAFLGCGSLSRPRSPAHLEWRVSSEAAALQLRELAEAEGFALGMHETSRHWMVYAKSRETIRGLLAALGAHGAELRLEEEGVFAWAREEANRLANADSGNLRRQAAASARHTDAIERVGGPDALPPELRVVAELRLRLPDATLAELGEAARPRLSKSAVASRLRRIVERAEDEELS